MGEPRLWTLPVELGLGAAAPKGSHVGGFRGPGMEPASSALSGR